MNKYIQIKFILESAKCKYCLGTGFLFKHVCMFCDESGNGIDDRTNISNLIVMIMNVKHK